MKIKIAIAVLIMFAGFTVTVFCVNNPALIVGGLATIDNTTNLTASASFGSVTLFPYTSFAITNAGLTATNALQVQGQCSIDGSNWMTVVTWHPSVTNATNVAWLPAPQPQAMYWRLSVITTNSVNVGIVAKE